MKKTTAVTNAREPLLPEIETVVADEERRTLAESEVPEDVKSETLMRLETFAEIDLEQQQAEDARNEP